MTEGIGQHLYSFIAPDVMPEMNVRMVKIKSRTRGRAVRIFAAISCPGSGRNIPSMKVTSSNATVLIFRLLSTSEPIVNAMLGLDSLAGSPCGRHSIRFTPRRYIIPCVYWPQPDLTLADLDGLTGESILDSEQFRRARRVPDACRDCPHVASCGGGCASRRLLLGDLTRPETYCPLVRGETMELAFTPAPEKDLPRGGNVCTTIILP